MTTERYFSPTAIELWLNCKRKFGWRYIAKIPAPQTGAASLGSEVHSQLEKYLLGIPFDFTRESGEIALSGIEHLPDPPLPEEYLEGSFKFRRGGFLFGGRKDFELPPDAEGYPTVGDHKTCGSFEYAKTADDLLYDPQAIMYAANALVKWPDAQGVNLEWIYYRTRGKRASKRVHLRMMSSHVEEVFPEIEALAGEMQNALDTVTDVFTLNPNPSHCDAYGGCPYRDTCNLTARERLSAIMSTTTNGSSLLASLRQRANITPVTIPASTPGITFNDSWKNAPDAGPPVVPGVAINPPEFQTPPPSPPFAVAPLHKIEEPKKRCRRTKAQMAQDAATDDTEDLKAAIEAAQEPGRPFEEVKKDLGITTSTRFPIDTLYVDCITDGVCDAAILLIDAKALVNKEANVSDYRFLPFGTGNGALAVAMEKVVREAMPGPLFVSSKTPEGQAILSTLIALSMRVVRGV